MTSPWCRPAKGGVRETASHRMMPKLYRSAAGVSLPATSSSGGLWGHTGTCCWPPHVWFRFDHGVHSKQCTAWQEAQAACVHAWPALCCDTSSVVRCDTELQNRKQATQGLSHVRHCAVAAGAQVALQRKTVNMPWQPQRAQLVSRAHRVAAFADDLRHPPANETCGTALLESLSQVERL